MTPAEIGPSAGDDSIPTGSKGGSGVFENSPFTQILETVPFGLFVLDADGAPVYSNSAANRILGRALPERPPLGNLAETYSAYLAGTDKLYPLEQMPIMRALAGETSTVSDMEIRHPDGSTFLQVSGAPVLDGSGRVLYAVAVFHDISAHRSVEAALQLLADELAERARERAEQIETLKLRLADTSPSARENDDPPGDPDDDLIEPCGKCTVFAEVEQTRKSAALARRALNLFIANFSHELRTPLNHIIGFSDLIESKIQSGVTHDIEEHAVNIRASGASLLDTLDKIITVAEAESSELRLSLEIFDVGPVVQEVAAKFAPVAKRNGNSFELAIEGELGLVQSDGARIRAALAQIIENACKHCRGGAVTVTASRTGSGTDGSIEIVVRDTGSGFDATRASLLAAGTVVPGESLRDTGLGIGIPLAAQSLRALGGALEVETSPGDGTRLLLRFPTYTRA
ncbi:MAG: ATP-binding protein [Thermoanaerobaculia bacterium]|nr:ATP-binding protein [Thermoanaerobaculia bacterium]